ncbi:response regulator [Acuticoccus sp. I52.16.1]|uniref:response regulator n=1 Tax=Acuticoccus sp. I52.16.1 TaxID=2928472 RepID=UPI001FD1D4C5|nr:response regulator [Acuticoccus sp. I52.16.1]UOM34758.1 response regulator [Acuticoccus sp. I52.16.1]
MNMTEPIKILLLEDNPADVELTREAFLNRKLRLTLDVVHDGNEALDYLHRRGVYVGRTLPDLVILDLNVPRVSGKSVIAEIKSTELLKRLPIVVLTSSSAETDVIESYDLGANCYVNKPLDFSSFEDIVVALESFWFTVVRLPTIEEATE